MLLFTNLIPMGPARGLEKLYFDIKLKKNTRFSNQSRASEGLLGFRFGKRNISAFIGAKLSLYLVLKNFRFCNVSTIKQGYHTCLGKWDSRRYLKVFFFPKIENLQILFWYMRRMAEGVGAFESPDLGAPSRYLKHILLSSRKNLEVSEVEESIEKWENFKSNFEIWVEIFSFFNWFFDFRGL